MRYLTQSLTGLLFGFGLALAGMTSPAKVLAFLDVAGEWNASLLFVLGAAVLVAGGAFHLILRRSRPLLDDAFHLTDRRAVDGRLIVGSVVFGVGWGIAGYCPGPAVALLAAPSNPEGPIFLTGLFIGLGLVVAWDRLTAHH